jgi:iron complex transport system ATP-binding protein
MARLLRPHDGAILLEGEEIRAISTGEIARSRAILPQQPETPAGITVWDLIGYGRYPHQGVT